MWDEAFLVGWEQLLGMLLEFVYSGMVASFLDMVNNFAYRLSVTRPLYSGRFVAP